MQGAFFYSGILAFASGIFVRSFFVTSWYEIIWIGFITFVLGVWLYKNRYTAGAPYLLCLIVILSSFMLGLVRLQLVTTLAPTSTLATQLGQKVELTGTVIAEPEVTAKSTRLIVLVGDERVLVSTDRYATVLYGDEVTFKGKLEKPESFETEFGRMFNYPGYLAVRHIFYTVSFSNIVVSSSGHGQVVLAQLLYIKKKFLESIQLAIPDPEVGLGAGLLLGVKSSLGDELEDAFRATGIIHIVVLSGANIMLVVMFVMYMLALLFPVRVRAVIGIGVIILFSLMVGFSATVVRASIMATFILLALLLGRKYAIMRALFFAGVLMLMINPLLLVYDVGFQLSFLATLGLVIVAPQLETMLQSVSARFKLKEYFLATVATQVAILPLLLYQIGQFSIVAVVVNMLVLPLVPVAMLFTFITGVVGLLSTTIASVTGVGAYFSLKYIIVVATKFAAIPGAAFVVPAFPFFVVPLAYAIIGFIVYRLWAYKTNTTPEIDVSSVDAWTVVEEQDEVTVKTTSGHEPSSHPDIPKSLPPIFFR